MTLILPIINGSSGVWGTILNDALNGMDAIVTKHTQDIASNLTKINANTSAITTLDGRLDTIDAAPPPSAGGFILCTSTTRPPLKTGQIILETDTGFMSYDSSQGNGTLRVPFPGQCIVKFRKTTTQALSTGADESIEWNQISNDRLGGWSASSPTLYRVQVPGIYQVAANCSWGANTSGYRRIEIRLNGAPLNGTSATINAVSSGPTMLHTPSALVRFAVGETIEVSVRHNSSASTISTSTSTSEQPGISCVYFGNCIY